MNFFITFGTFYKIWVSSSNALLQKKQKSKAVLLLFPPIPSVKRSVIPSFSSRVRSKFSVESDNGLFSYFKGAPSKGTCV